VTIQLVTPGKQKLDPHQTPRRARVRPPLSIPGRFFVVQYDRDLDTYEIHLDDADLSHYVLGSNLQEIRTWFRACGHDKLGDEALDRAREFGACQATIETGFVRSLLPPGKPPDLFANEPGREDSNDIPDRLLRR
jgi:hypothetical protein